MLCYVMLCYVMLCYVMLCYVMLCYVMLCYVMLCYVMLCFDNCRKTFLLYTLETNFRSRKLKGLLNSISIAGSDNPLVEVEYKGKQSNVSLTTQGESTLKIFGE